MGDSIDEIIEIYKRDVDRTLIRENLRLTPEERLRSMEAALRFIDGARHNAEAARQQKNEQRRRVCRLVSMRMRSRGTTNSR
jgi:hypothetical protein